MHCQYPYSIIWRYHQFQGIPPAPSICPIVKEGYLMKLEHKPPLGTIVWRRRFCILSRGTLYFYKSEVLIFLLMSFWWSRTVHIMLTIVHDAYTAAPPTRNFHKLFIAMKVENIPSPPLEKADMQNSYCG